MIKKIFKITGITILSLVIFFILYKQYQVENYMIKQKVTYHILANRKRIHYSPFIVHFINHEIMDKGNFSLRLMPYDEMNLKSVYCDKDFDIYMAYCYFSEEEINSYLFRQSEK